MKNTCVPRKSLTFTRSASAQNTPDAIASGVLSSVVSQKMPNRRTESMEIADVATLFAFLPQMVKMIPCGRGAGFANCRKIVQRLHCEVFCRPLLRLAERRELRFTIQVQPKRSDTRLENS